MRFVNFLIKPASSLCNMKCKYCFYEDEAKNRETASMGIMTQETADELIRQAYSGADYGGNVSFAFQGGEPTLAGLSFFRHFVNRAKEWLPDGVRVQFSIQTNGSLINEEWAEFLKDSDFLAGISIDGFKDLHNLHRVDQRGKGTWNSVLRGLKALQDFHVKVNALCVVTSLCSRNPRKTYEELKRIGFHNIQYIPCLDPLGEERGLKRWSLTPSDYGRFLCELFDLWYQDWKNGQYCSVRLFDDYVHLLMGEEGSSCAVCGMCGGYFVVEADGSVYPCDFYMLDNWKLGNIHKDTLYALRENNIRTDFLTRGQSKPSECLSCSYRSICNGGCPNDWIVENGKPHNYYCSALKQFFQYAGSRMLYIAKAEYQANIS